MEVGLDLDGDRVIDGRRATDPRGLDEAREVRTAFDGGSVLDAAIGVFGIGAAIWTTVVAVTASGDGSMDALRGMACALVPGIGITVVAVVIGAALGLFTYGPVDVLAWGALWASARAIDAGLVAGTTDIKAARRGHLTSLTDAVSALWPCKVTAQGGSTDDDDDDGNGDELADRYA
jgi:hypothetical protein